jgi:hypothetical protein
MKDLLKISDNLLKLEIGLVEHVASNKFNDVEGWLKKNKVVEVKDMRLLQNHLRRTFQLFRKQWMEDGYEDYWEARELTKKNFRKADTELSKILRALRDLRRQP